MLEVEVHWQRTISLQSTCYRLKYMVKRSQVFILQIQTCYYRVRPQNVHPLLYLTTKELINSFCLHAPVKPNKRPSLPNTYVFLLYVDAPTLWLCCAYVFSFLLLPAPSRGFVVSKLYKMPSSSYSRDPDPLRRG